MFDADPELELPNLIEMEQWTFILNRFSEVLGIDIYTVDRQGKPVTRPQHPPKIWECIAFAKDPSRLNFKTPSESIQRLIQKSRETGGVAEETNTVGFTQALIPIFDKSSRLLAYVVVGPLVLGSRKSRAELEALALEQGWDPLDLDGAHQELKFLSFVGMKAILDLLSEVCHYLVQPTPLRGGHEKILSEFTSSWRQDLTTNPSKLDSFFSTLLDLALRATKADSGSVMMLDPHTQTLRIRVAHGLKEEIVRQTELKIGEGIAGWVAQRNKPLLIDPEAPDEQLPRDRLKRRDIDSSIVMPLSRRNEVLGILNINSHDRNNRLKAQSLDLLSQLAKLTMVIFQSI